MPAAISFAVRLHLVFAMLHGLATLLMFTIDVYILGNAWLFHMHACKVIAMIMP